MYKKILKIMGFSVLNMTLFSNANAARLMDVIEKASISGFAFGRFINVHGRDAAGSRWQLRLKPIITSGEVAGFSATASIFFSKGSTTPDDNNTDGDISGSRGDVVSAFVDRFNIADFYLTYNAESLGTKSIIQGGQKSVVTPFNDTILDRALGIFIENKDLKYLNMSFQWWDSWMGDDIFISRSTPSSGQMVGLGNNAFIFGFKSGDEFSKDTGFAYNFWYGAIHRYLNYMIFADVSYTLNLSGHTLTFLAQSSASGLVDKPILMSNLADYNTLYRASYNYAKNRGMYNLRVDYKYSLDLDSGGLGDSESKDSIGISGAIGIAGSFMDGYGTMIDNTGGLKLGGILWNNFAGTEANGFGLFGAGGFNDSSIFLTYASAKASYKKFETSLDVVFVNTSHFFILRKASNAGGYYASATNLNSATSNIHGTANKFIPATFLEISPAVSYKFTKNISATLQYGYLMGDLSMGRIRAQVNYVF